MAATLGLVEDELATSAAVVGDRNVVLTDAGRLLLEHGSEASAALERAEAAIAELHGEPTGSVRIGSLASPAASIIPAALRSLRDEYPRVEAEVVVHPLDRNVEELRLGSIDIAVEQLFDSAPHQHFDGFEQVELLREPMVLLSPASDPVTSIDHAAELDWVAAPASSACGRETRRVAAEAGFALRSRYETEEHHATVRIVAAGLAVALAPPTSTPPPTGSCSRAWPPRAAGDLSRPCSPRTCLAGPSWRTCRPRSWAPRR